MKKVKIWKPNKLKNKQLGQILVILKMERRWILSE